MDKEERKRWGGKREEGGFTLVLDLIILGSELYADRMQSISPCDELEHAPEEFGNVNMNLASYVTMCLTNT